SVTSALDGYDVSGACATVREFLEVLTNWYVRRSRDRFWAGDSDAIDTLHTVLEVVCRVAAPLLPLTTETVWRGLTGERSVHLAVKAGEWTTAPDGTVLAAGIELLPGEYDRRLVATDRGATAELPAGSGLVVLDTDVTPELAAEGVARDLIRVIQQARRAAGLDVSDRISLTVAAPDDVVAAARTHEPFIRRETVRDSLPRREPLAG